MNALPLSKKALILSHLVEGNSIRSIERITGVHRDTILRLLNSAGEKALDILDSELVNLEPKRIQLDEVWTYVSKKQARLSSEERKAGEYGDQYVFVAFDPQTKLVVAFTVGKRTLETTLSFMYDLKTRIRTRFQLTTDSFKPYYEAVDRTFGDDIDYAQIHKTYSNEDIKGEHRYSQGCLVGINIRPLLGNPIRKYISTSLVERQNLTMRMQMRRFTRLTNAFSKKLQNLKAALALHFLYYNFIRIHQSLRITPAMQAGITNHIWTWEELLTNHQLKQAT
ncbi:MAG: IS1 family transposase [Bacteroidota bacterium]